MGTATQGVDVPTGTTRTSDELSRAGWNARSALQHAIKEQVLVQEETCSVQKYSLVELSSNAPRGLGGLAGL